MYGNRSSSSDFSTTSHTSSLEANSSGNSAGGGSGTDVSMYNLPPVEFKERALQQPSVKDLAAASSPKLVARKPTPMETKSRQQKQHQLVVNTAPPRTRDHNQMRIEELEMLRDDLASRKIKVGSAIHELTQVVQPSPISYDLAMRGEVKRAVADLNDQFAEIQKEEYNVGLKLVGAWRRRDERDLYGSDSSLWVRRVTT